MTFFSFFRETKKALQENNLHNNTDTNILISLEITNPYLLTKKDIFSLKFQNKKSMFYSYIHGQCMFQQQNLYFHRIKII